MLTFILSVILVNRTIVSLNFVNVVETLRQLHGHSKTSLQIKQKKNLELETSTDW